MSCNSLYLPLALEDFLTCPPGDQDLHHWGAVKGKEHRELAKLEMHGHALCDTLWQEGVAMFGSHPESKKGPAEKSRVGCKNTVLQLLFGLKVSHKGYPRGEEKG